MWKEALLKYYRLKAKQKEKLVAGGKKDKATTKRIQSQ